MTATDAQGPVERQMEGLRMIRGESLRQHHPPRLPEIFSRERVKIGSARQTAAVHTDVVEAGLSRSVNEG